jgi:hypothetical protein
VGGSHESGHFLVPHLHELNTFPSLFSALERAQHTVDAVTGVAEDAGHAPCSKAFNKKITGQLCHAVSQDRKLQLICLAVALRTGRVHAINVSARIADSGSITALSQAYRGRVDKSVIGKGCL